MIPYGQQTLNAPDIKAVLAVLRSDFITQGPKIAAFEQALAKYCAAKYAVVCSNGTAALHLAYLAAGLKTADQVITAPNTFVATSNMLLALGAKPIFCDIRLDTYNIDENKIEKLINQNTKAIVPVHFAGQPAVMDKIHTIARRHQLIIIEDASHALGAKFKNSKIGDCRYSDMAILSFHPVKPITTAEGGAILTNSKKYYQKLILFRNHGIHKNKQGKNVMTELGYNYRLTDIAAALGISQLKKLDKFIKARRKDVNWYGQELKNVKEIILPQELKDNYSGWHIYVIRTQNAKLRDKLMVYLKCNGVGVNFHYPAVYSHPYYRRHGFKNISLRNEEIYQQTCLTLPCYPKLTHQQVKFISRQIKKFYD